MTIKITGTGSALPEKVMTNQELEKMVETDDAWIVERTGIRQRRIAESDTVAQLAARAGEEALKSAGYTAREVDLILVATCSPEQFLPCCACQVQQLLQADHAVCFDINAACSGFLFALDTAYAYLCAGLYRNALIIGAEVLSKLVDYTDRGTCILFGDGAGAVFVEPAKGSVGIQSIVQGSDGSQGTVLSCDTMSREGIRMDGKAVYRFATRQVPVCIEQAVRKAGFSLEEIDWYILHQANVRILESIGKRLGIPMEKIPQNLERVGNMSSAAIPVLLDELLKCGKIKKGQKIVLSGFGAGLTYGACVLIWD